MLALLTKAHNGLIAAPRAHIGVRGGTQVRTDENTGPRLDSLGLPRMAGKRRGRDAVKLARTHNHKSTLG
jgi:hypothetical protein